MKILLTDNRMDIFYQMTLFHFKISVIIPLLIIAVRSCPDQCASCLHDDMLCEKVGLLEIPKLNENIKNVTILNQQFMNPVLTSGNFSVYRKLTDLSIRLSNLNRIRQYALSALSELRNVDFSENTELIIEHSAFFRLNLVILKLDNMGDIKLDNQAFNGLSVDTLSIQNSHLLSLPVELIQPIAHSIRKLLLKSNLLRSLDSKLKPVLIGLKSLELQDNPFICNCKLLWLSEILNNRISGTKLIDSYNQDDLYPKCVSPPELRKQYVYTLVKKLKNCIPPTIVQIDVVYLSYTMVGLNCMIKEPENVNELTKIGWFPSKNSSLLPKSWKRFIEVPISTSPIKYKCKAQNELGNSEIDLILAWNEGEKPAIVLENSTFKFEETFIKQSFLWEKVFSLFEMICAIFGTLVITVILFLLFCCCYVERSHLLLIGKKKRKLQTKSYPSYERGVYSDTRIYCETDMDVCPFPPPPPPTPPPVPDTRLIPKSLL